MRGRTLASKVSAWVVLFAAAVFVTAFGYLFRVSRQAVIREAFHGAGRILDNAILRADAILSQTELLSDNLEWLLYKIIDQPDRMLVLSQSFLQNNEFLYGCTISFRPEFYPREGTYFCCRSVRRGGEIVSRQVGGDQYQYFYLDWYLLPQLFGQPCWTEPYKEADGRRIVSHCRPMFDAKGEFCGVISLDISLDWLSESLSRMKPYPHSYAVLLGRGGTYLVHPDPEKRFYQSIFTRGLVSPDALMQDLGQHMVQLGEGVKKLNANGRRSYVFFRPLRRTGWSMALVCPVMDVLGSFYRLQNKIVLIILSGLACMFALFVFVIRRQLSPLRMLSAQAERIAGGDFGQPLPPSDRGDEIGTLTRAFGDMQSSLVSYMDELSRAVARRERMDNELRIARDIQMAMAPRTFPPFPSVGNLDLHAYIQPAREVGGDLYDFSLQGDKLYFCVGDVSGKGIPASLFMVVVCNLFRMMAGQGLSPADMAGRLNAQLSGENDQMMFVTLFIGCLDIHTKAFSFCSCGHNPPILVRGDGASFLDTVPNVPLGICPGQVFAQQLLPCLDATLLLYTDGLTEAEDAAHEAFGEGRVLEALRLGHAASLSSREVVELLLARVADHVKDAEPSDDLTLLCLKLA